MSVSTARFKGQAIKRRILRAKHNRLYALDSLQPQDSYSPASDEANGLRPFNTIGEIKDWWFTSQKADKGTVFYEFHVRSDDVITPDVLSRCHLALGNKILRVETRNAPFGDQDIEYVLVAYLSGEIYADHPSQSYPRFKDAV